MCYKAFHKVYLNLIEQNTLCLVLFGLVLCVCIREGVELLNGISQSIFPQT